MAMNEWERLLSMLESGRYGRTPEKPREPTVLEKTFGVQTSAKVIAFDATREYGLNYLPEAVELARRYVGIFSRNQEAADGYIDVENYGEKTDSFHMQFIRKDEAEYMADFLFRPSLSSEQIRKRQEIIQKLVNSKDLDKLVNLKNKSYKTAEGIGDFISWAGNETMQETFAELYWAGEKERRVYMDEHGSDVDHTEPLFPYVFECVDEMEEGLASLKELWGVLQTQDPQIKDTFTEVLDTADQIRSKLTGYIPFDKSMEVEMLPRKEKEKDKDYRGRRIWEVNHIPEELGRINKEGIEPALFKIGSILEFAKKIRDEGWARVTFDKDRPYGYKGGWNLERRKDNQVQNDSAEDSPIVVLSGANTSGKSYMMRTDFLMRICAQSLGFAPAKEANFPVHENFVYLDRASTDPENDLSAFMREVKNWQMALANTRGNTRWYVDEGYSTTSPKDQAALLFATAEHIAKAGGSVVLATHNDNVIERAVKDGNSKIYHLKTEVGERGELIRYFELKPGAMESLSIAVAKARGFPAKILEWAVGYFQHKIKNPEVSNSSDFPKIEPFSNEEREKGKLVSKSLYHMFPHKPVEPIFGLFSLDHDFKGYFLSGLLRGKDILSADRIECADPHEASEILDFLRKMIMWNGALGSRELLERQRMFVELSKDDIARNLQEGIGRVGFLEETLALIARHAAEINRGLNIFRREGEIFHKKVDFNSMDVDAAIAFLTIQKKLLGAEFRFDGLLEDFRHLSEIDKPSEEEEALFDKDIKILEEINSSLPPVHLKDIDIDDIKDELRVLESSTRGSEAEEDQEEKKNRRKETGWLWSMAKALDLFAGGLPCALQRIEGDLKDFDEFIAQLKLTDSVYLHQAASHMEAEVNFYRAILEGKEVKASDEFTVLPSDKELSRFNHLTSYGSPYSVIEKMRDTKDTPFKKALKQLDALLMFSQIINKDEFVPVRFNDTGEIELTDSFSIFKPKNEQVKNSVRVNPNDKRVELLTGPNGSGKTFYEKGTVASVLIALSTGFAPAQSATMPIFDGVVYLDRVIKKQDKKLSAFSQEVEYWKELLSIARNKRAVFVVVDEAFSSTSPTYQAAFTYAVIAEFLESNHFLMLSTHNHEVVDQLEAQRIPSVQPLHFKYSIKDGKIKYDYVVQEGHEQSHALEVARTIDLPEDIVSASS